MLAPLMLTSSSSCSVRHSSNTLKRLRATLLSELHNGALADSQLDDSPSGDSLYAKTHGWSCCELRSTNRPFEVFPRVRELRTVKPQETHE